MIIYCFSDFLVKHFESFKYFFSRNEAQWNKLHKLKNFFNTFDVQIKIQCFFFFYLKPNFFVFYYIGVLNFLCNIYLLQIHMSFKVKKNLKLNAL